MDNPLLMVRTLKGSPLSILIALSLVRKPVTAEWLESMTGYTDKPIKTGLRVLEEYGYVSRINRSNWIIANIEVFQLGEFDNLIQNEPGKAIANHAGQEDETDPTKTEILKELNRIGIKSPTAERLAVLNWVTVEYIRGIVKQLRQVGKENQTGLIIHKIKSHDKVKEIKSPREYYLNDGYICDKCFTNPCTCEND